MDSHVGLEYKCHMDVTTNIKFQANANPENIFYFQHKPLGWESFTFIFIIGI
jgi:hypothetical protein